MSRNNRFKKEVTPRAKREDYKPAFPNIATKEASDRMSIKSVYFRGVLYPHHFQIIVPESARLELGQIIGFSELNDEYHLIWGGRESGIIQINRLGDRVLEFTEAENQSEKDGYPYVLFSLMLRDIIKEIQKKED